MERLQNEADEVQAEGIVGARIIERSHGWGSHVIEFFAIGTAVVATSEKHIIEKPAAGAAAAGLTGAPPLEHADRRARRPDPRAALPRRAAQGVLRPVPRAHTRGGAGGAHLRGRADDHGAQRADHVPGTRDRLAERPGRSGDPRPNHASFMDHFFTAGVRAPPGPVHGQVPAVRIPGSRSTSSATVASSRSAAGSPTRRRSSPRSQCSRGVARSACTARAGARAPASWPSQARPGIGRLALESGAPDRAGLDPRLPPGAQPGAAAGCTEGGRPLRRPRCASRLCMQAPSREHQQEASDVILERIRVDAHRDGGPRRLAARCAPLAAASCLPAELSAG